MGRLANPKHNTLDDWLKWQESLHTKEIDLGLDRIKKVYERLFPKGVPFKVISVAGTNGKGSTIAFIASIYSQSNLKVAKFTSPHLFEYNERFTINSKQASDEQICHAFETIEELRNDTSLTYFEFSTLAALVIFSLEKVDIAILEVGLGARLDSVNTVDSDISVITNIDIDHVEYLGDTRELIGFEKAGIMRSNKPCICGDVNPPKSLIKHAKSINASLILVDSPYLGETHLKGDHQKQNAAVAIETIKQLSTIFPVTQKQITQGIKQASLPGRWQLKIINDKTIIFDVAHNVAATQALANELSKKDTSTLAIFCALKNKNIDAMIDKIKPVISQWLLVPLNVDRAISIQELSKKFNLSDKIKACDNMNSAVQYALNSAQFQRVVIFGSFYTVADASKALNKLH